jgi:DNA-binding PadR family transcriptional regulator
MNNRRTATSHAVLGLLSIQPWTTYELAKQVQRSLNWFWPRAERKLYDEPKRLVDQGLATATRQSTGRRPRTVYAITRSGRRALRRWLDEPAAPPSLEFEGMLKVFFADAGTLEQLRATLTRIEAQATARLDALAAMATSDPLPFPERAHLSALSIRLHMEQERTLTRWARWARDQVAEWDSTSDPGTWDAHAQLAELRDAAAE